MGPAEEERGRGGWLCSLRDSVGDSRKRRLGVAASGSDAGQSPWQQRGGEHVRSVAGQRKREREKRRHCGGREAFKSLAARHIRDLSFYPRTTSTTSSRSLPSSLVPELLPSYPHLQAPW